MSGGAPGADAYDHVSRSLYRRRWFDLGLGLARIAPRGWLRALGAAAGWAYPWFRPAKARVAVAQVRRIAPEYRGGAGPIYSAFGRVLADYFKAGVLEDAGVERMAGARRGYENLLSVIEAGRGGILATLHFGFFELGGWLLGRMRVPLVALTRPEPDPTLTRWRAEFRKRWGVETVEVGADPFGLVAAYHALRAGRLVAALIDRPHPRQRVAVAMPGGSVWCSTAVLHLAARSGAPVLPMAVHEGPDGRHHFLAGAPVAVGRDTAGFPGAAARIWAGLAGLVREHPEQYFQFEEMDK